MVNATINIMPLKTKGLCGIAFVGDKKDTIILNSNRNKLQINFDCAHEFIHLVKHRDLGVQSFNCFEKAKPMQNFSLEWQANEGAAEFLVPYKILLPMIKENYHRITSNWSDTYDFKKSLEEKFNVPEAVIHNRLESLKYEIHQYINGSSIANIKVLSNSAQVKQGIDIRSINDIQNKNFIKTISSWKELKKVTIKNKNPPLIKEGGKL